MVAASACNWGWASPKNDAADQALLNMRVAFQKSDRATLSALLPAVQGHDLQPLAAYWELKARLDTASPDEINAFFQRYAGTYYEDRLRNDWLLQLGKNTDWPRFLAALPAFRMQDDREVQCYTLQANPPVAGTLAAAQQAEQLKKLWLAQKRADQGCASTAAVWLQAHLLPREVVWQRARWAMDYYQPEAATQAVKLLDPDWVDTVNRLYEAPSKYLDDKLTAVRPRTKELVTLALVRLAALDPDAAAEQADKLRWRTWLRDEELSWVWGTIGKRQAQRLDPSALSAFARANNSFLNDDMLAWKARAALRAGQWQTVASTIASMGTTQQAEPTWTYWMARSLQAQGSPAASAQAQSLFQRIASPHGFYEQLALEALGQTIQPPAPPAALTLAEVASVRQDPGLQRALQAIDLGLRSEGVREWNYTVAMHQPGGMSDRELLAAADWACQRAVWDRCISTSLRTQNEVDINQRFPMPYHDAVLQRSRAIGLDPAYVYGLIRQESRFVTSAASAVGASGLMQVMPATAKWTAKKLGMSNFRPEQLNERDTNITIGTAYLKLALDDLDDAMPLAAAAYNAGPNRARRWREGPVLEGAIWAENIPFEETRNYVKHVLANTTMYAAIISGAPQKLSTRLGTVGPRSASQPEPNPDLP